MKLSRLCLHRYAPLVWLIIAGCSTTFEPRGKPAKPNLVPDLSAGAKISLVNAQPATERVTVGEVGMGRSVYGNLHTWTEKAIAALKGTLARKGVAVDPNSAKSLRLAITKAQLAPSGGGWAFQCTVDFTVELSDGQRLNLQALKHSWKYLDACDFAVTEVALVTLKDERVRKFLEAP